MNNDKVMAGAEPFYFPGNDIGVLISHGFTGTTQSMLYLGQQIAAAGYTVMGLRLKGHGTTPEDLATTTASDWIASVDAALAELRKTCTQVFMAGLSMGGTLTLYTAGKHADLLAGIIAINAPIQIGVPDLAGLALDPNAPEFIPGIGSDVKDPDVKELAYDRLPIAALRQGYLLTAVAHDMLARVYCPALIMQSRDDNVVQPDNALRIVQRLGAGRIELLWLDNSYHVATIDFDKDIICNASIAFIRSVAGP